MKYDVCLYCIWTQNIFLTVDPNQKSLEKTNLFE